MNAFRPTETGSPLPQTGSSLPIDRIAHGFVADARKVTPRQFLDALGLVPDREQYRINLRADTRRAILRGDVHGYPAVLVAEIREEMRAEQEAVDRLVEIAPRSAVGMLGL